MADRGDTHYRVPSLNAWFAFSSLVFLIACFWMVIDDWNRPWKKYQREFREIEIERGRAELESPLAEQVRDEEARIAKELEQAEGSLEANRSAIEEAAEDLRLKKGDQFVATEAEKVAKQVFNWERYIVEEERLHLIESESDPKRLAAGEAELDERLRPFVEEMAAAQGKKETADLIVAQAEKRLRDLQAVKLDAEKALKDAGKSLDLTRTKLAKIAPEDAPTKVANVLRDFPGMDFIGPSLKVNKVVLENLTFELNFTRKKRIDMCTTCHVPVDRAGYEEEEQPFASHPRLDLYLSAKSPHPINEMGCTICHRGSGEALDFIRSDHRAGTEEQEHERHAEYHWHKQHHWDYPMLRSQDIEASCVQCHKTSMDLIAEEAPKVTQGFQNFERFGCYACHKVDWFPTKRRPGPSLKNIRQKTDADFIASWIADPKAFRPTTWMPQIFHLENFGPEDEVVISHYGEAGKGRPILGQEWNDSAVAAVTAFIWDRSADEPAEPLPFEGDSARGAEAFRLSGCLACHNLAPYEGEPELRDLALEARGENEHGPNLRGVATKITPEWLYAWIREPHAYWSETRMPNLRLSEQDAADIVAYVMEDPDGVFRDVPEGWEPAPSPYDREVLEEQARWFFSRDGRSVVKERFENEWADDRKLLNAVGEKFVLNQGCHSCHEITGLENAQPIGAELTNWGSKTVDKLDWGFMAEILQEEHGWTYREKLEHKNYREGWLAQKLHEPRSFDRQKVKNPLEKLKMPWFRFEQEQIDAITTFVVGLVDDEVQAAKMKPDDGELAMDDGLRAIRQKNCAACHVIEPGRVTFEDEDGNRRTVEAEFLALEEDVLPLPMSDLQGLRDYVATYEEDLETEVEEIGIRLLGPAPGVGEPGENIFVEPDRIVDVKAPWGGDFVSVVTDYYLQGQELYFPEDDVYERVTADPDGEGRVEDVDGEWRSYQDEPFDKVRWTFAPPVLWAEGHKLQKDWFYGFLYEPMPLREQMRVRMPSFTWNEGEAGAIADYFAYQAVRDWPSLYTRELRMAEGLSPDELGTKAGISGALVTAIENGDPVAISANLPAVLKVAAELGFQGAPAVSPEHERIRRRSANHVDEMLAAHPEWEGKSRIEMGELIAREGPQCFQCHFYRGTPPLDGAAKPLAWAPDLFRVRERLREDWTYEWLWNPAKKYPGTAMPANFARDKAQYQELYPDSTSEDQIQAVMDWLYNTDRAFPNGLSTQ